MSPPSRSTSSPRWTSRSWTRGCCATSAAQNRDFENSLSALLPRSMIPVVIARSGIDPMQKVNSITKQQRRALLETIKCFPVPIACKAPVEDAIVTSGGVKVSEVNAKTMESKRVQGLYFAGELLDVDAYTGGFNLQIAWATGRLAGRLPRQKNFHHRRMRHEQIRFHRHRRARGRGQEHHGQGLREGTGLSLC
ncbi:MAG: NAD(P)/FAD-dependent oxidoreductase [Oscillospiraceae bacterium]